MDDIKQHSLAIVAAELCGVDEIYKIGKENGALGGKLLGAGAGGSMMFYCPIEKQKSLIKSLNKLKYIDFKIDEAGTSIVRI